MTTVSEVLPYIAEKGYGKELVIKRDMAIIKGSEKEYAADQLAIVRTFRFEGESDPGDMTVIYAIVADDGERAYLFNAYGPYSNQDNPYYDEFIKKVPINEQDDF
jgi:hypothetical protein